MKKILSSFLVILFLSSLVLAQTAEMSNEAKKLYNEGNKQRKAGNYQGAVEKYDEALKLTTDYRVYYQKGVTLKKLRKYDEALASLNKCAESKSDFSTVYNALGGIYFAQGNYDKAIENFEKFAKYASKERYKKKANQYIALAYTKKALTAKTDGKHQKAIDFLNNAVNHSKYDKAYLALAEIYVEVANYDAALEAADKALNYRSKISKGGPYYFKGMAFKGKGENAKAKESFKMGVKDRTYGQLCKYELETL